MKSCFSIQETARSFIHTVAMLAEAVTFVYIGMTVFVVKDVQWNGGLIAVSIVSASSSLSLFHVRAKETNP